MSIPYTYLHGRPVTLTNYYRMVGTRVEDCPVCKQPTPRFSFRSRQGVWMCWSCAMKLDRERWRKGLERLS
jgi:ribosomal protein L37AE/L43A